MIAEIVATGDEIRSGALIDSNSAYIAEKLEESGLEVKRHHSTGDDIAVMTNVLREISSRADIAIVTGGLGPTTDDVTTEAAARTAGVKLALNESALADIRGLFAKFGRPMSISNEKQALFPAGSEILKNPVGTAPGFSIKIGKCTFYFVPGVPFEMQKMITDHVIPSIIKLQGSNKKYNFTRTISTFGLGESVVGEQVASVEQEFKNIKLGLRASFPVVHIKLYIHGENENYLKKTLDEAAEWVIKKIGEFVFSPFGKSIEEEIGDLLKSKNATLAIAESCTGGLIADLISNVPGCSDYFFFQASHIQTIQKCAFLELMLKH
jgi:nicotinamide-nucleotide amidase